MQDKNLYPKTIEELLKRVDFIIESDSNEDRVKNMTYWKKWFTSLDYQLNEGLNDSQYLRAFCKEKKCAMQIWNKKELVNSLEYNLLANYYSEYNTDKTQIVEVEEDF